MQRIRSQQPSSSILVAGGAGFIGTNLCETLLREGHEVFCVDDFVTGTVASISRLSQHANFTSMVHDICHPLVIDRKLPAIYNLACAASPPAYQADPVHTMMTNVLGTKNLLDLAQEHGAVLVQASTSEIYGDPEQHPQQETYRGLVNCTGPRACYDEGKRAAEALCFDYLRAGRADARVARIFNTYGPYMRPDDGRVVSNFIVQALSARPITIYGEGCQTRSFCYVADLVDGLRRLAKVEPNPQTAINLGNPQEYTVCELADEIIRLIPHQVRKVNRPLPIDDPKHRRPDIRLAREILRWSPRVQLSEGLARTIDWFRQCLPAADANEAHEPARTMMGEGAGG